MEFTTIVQLCTCDTNVAGDPEKDYIIIVTM